MYVVVWPLNLEILEVVIQEYLSNYSNNFTFYPFYSSTTTPLWHDTQTQMLLITWIHCLLFTFFHCVSCLATIRVFITVFFFFPNSFKIPPQLPSINCIFHFLPFLSHPCPSGPSKDSCLSTISTCSWVISQCNTQCLLSSKVYCKSQETANKGQMQSTTDLHYQQVKNEFYNFKWLK